MAWPLPDRPNRPPEIQRGWDLVGSMVRRRRIMIRWTQRDLARAVGLAQSTISRLETGRLTGIRFDRFALVVAVMHGLDPEAPFPPTLPWRTRFDRCL